MCRVDKLWEIDEAHFPILETWLIDDRNIITSADEHWVGISIVLIGYIEGRAVRTDPRDKGHMPGGTESPDTICAWKDGYRTWAWGCSQGQTKAFRINDPIGGIAPIGGKVIAEKVPLLPCPPDTVTSYGKRTGAEGERVAIR